MINSNCKKSDANLSEDLNTKQMHVYECSHEKFQKDQNLIIGGMSCAHRIYRVFWVFFAVVEAKKD